MGVGGRAASAAPVSSRLVPTPVTVAIAVNDGGHGRHRAGGRVDAGKQGGGRGPG